MHRKGEDCIIRKTRSGLFRISIGSKRASLKQSRCLGLESAVGSF